MKVYLVMLAWYSKLCDNGRTDILKIFDSQEKADKYILENPDEYVERGYTSSCYVEEFEVE